MKPLVSILIPAYNAQTWIADTIKSAQDQTWPNKEIVIVDDGSRDETLAIARQFISDSVTVVTQKNQGAAAARNKAFELCRGDYIQWLDADDLLSSDKVARQMEVAQPLQDKGILLSCPWGHFMYRTSQAQFCNHSLCCDLSPIEWLLRKWENNLHMQTATWLVSRELSVAAGPWDTRLLGDDDGEYFFRVIKASRGIKFVSESKVFYRITASNRLSHIGRSDKKMEAQFLGMKLQIGYLRAMEDNERARRTCVNYLQTWLHNFYPNRPDLVEQAKQLAVALGGTLRTPKLPWKYAWIQKLFGWNAAKATQLLYNQYKSSVLRAWDRALSQRSTPPTGL